MLAQAARAIWKSCSEERQAEQPYEKICNSQASSLGRPIRRRRKGLCARRDATDRAAQGENEMSGIPRIDGSQAAVRRKVNSRQSGPNHERADERPGSGTARHPHRRRSRITARLRGARRPRRRRSGPPPALEVILSDAFVEATCVHWALANSCGRSGLRRQQNAHARRRPIRERPRKTHRTRCGCRKIRLRRIWQVDHISNASKLSG